MLTVAPEEDAYFARHDAETEALLGLLTLPLSAGPVLDLGCGRGLSGPGLRRLATGRLLEGIDLDAAALEQAQARGVYDRLICQDLVSWEPEQPYALIFARAVFHQIGSYSALLPWFARCLTPGGQMVFEIPRNESLAAAALARGLARAMFPALTFPPEPDDGGRLEDLWSLLRPLGEIRLEAQEKLQVLPPSEDGHPVRLLMENNLLRQSLAQMDFDQAQAYAARLDEQLEALCPVDPTYGCVFRTRSIRGCLAVS